MFPLHTNALPPDAATLRDALEESLRRVVCAPSQLVSVEEKNYPQLAAIRVSLDGASVPGQPPRPPAAEGPVEPALWVEQLQLNGRPLMVQGAAIDFSCTARDVRIGQARDARGNLLLFLQNAIQGSVEISAPLADLESLLLAGAKAEAAQRGVVVEAVRVDLQARSEHSLDVEVQVRARKLFLSATVRIKGRVEIDAKLQVRLSGLECAGGGPLGTLACNFLAPHLQRFNNRAFSLLAFSLGEVQLRDMKIAAGDKLIVTANFGSPA